MPVSAATASVSRSPAPAATTSVDDDTVSIVPPPRSTTTDAAHRARGSTSPRPTRPGPPPRPSARARRGGRRARPPGRRTAPPTRSAASVTGRWLAAPTLACTDDADRRQVDRPQVVDLVPRAVRRHPVGDAPRPTRPARTSSWPSRNGSRPRSATSIHPAHVRVGVARGSAHRDHRVGGVEEQPGQLRRVGELRLGEAQRGAQLERVGQHAHRLAARGDLDGHPLGRQHRGGVHLVHDRHLAGQAVGQQHRLVVLDQHRGDPSRPRPAAPAGRRRSRTPTRTGRPPRPARRRPARRPRAPAGRRRTRARRRWPSPPRPRRAGPCRARPPAATPGW